MAIPRTQMLRPLLPLLPVLPAFASWAPVLAPVVLAAAGLLASGNASAQAFQVQAQVQFISDGDTVRATVGQEKLRVRVLGIDAPEVPNKQAKSPGQPWGRESGEWLRAQLPHGTTIELRCIKADRYGRHVCGIRKAGQDLAAESVRQGMSHFDRANARDLPLADRLRYTALEQEARSARRGLWSQVEQPESPAAYRARVRASEN